MSVLSGGVSYPTVKFNVVGDSIEGTVIDFTDLQERDFTTKEPKVWKDGKPVMQTRVTLELPDESRVSLYVSGARMIKAVRSAIKEAGADDIEPLAKLSVTYTGKETTKSGTQAKCYTASYESFDPTV
jgi:hypothetical protein